MTQTILIHEAEFEKARHAFVKAWHEQDELLKRMQIPGSSGTRTTAGLKSALAELGIKVDA